MKKRKTKCKQCKQLCNSKYCLVCTSTCFRCQELVPIKKTLSKCQNCIDELKTLNPEQRKKDYSLMKNYGITYLEYKQILIKQDFKCFMCLRPPVKLSLSVDHEHEKGERKKDLRLRRQRVRGALCYPCNKALGILRDNAGALARGAFYLENWPAQEILNPSDIEEDFNRSY